MHFHFDYAVMQSTRKRTGSGGRDVASLCRRLISHLLLPLRGHPVCLSLSLSPSIDMECFPHFLPPRSAAYYIPDCGSPPTRRHCFPSSPSRSAQHLKSLLVLPSHTHPI